MEIDWEFLSKQFLTTGILVLIVQVIINFFFNKKIEKYKNRISKELEVYKKDLNIIINKDSSMFEKRIQIIDELYGKVVKLKFSLLSLSNEIQFIINDAATEEEKRVDNSINNFNDLQRFYLLKKIYFSNEICQKIDEIINIANKANWHYSKPLRMKNMGINESDEEFYSKNLSKFLK